MGIFDGCLLVSDFDGTLYFEGEIPKRNHEALEYFMTSGGLFSVASGRGPYAARKVFRLVKTNAPSLLVNGAVVFDPEKGEIIEAEVLGEKAKKKTAEIIEKFPDIGVEITMKDSIVTINENKDTILHRKSESFANIIKTYDEIKDEPWIKTLLMSSDEAVLNAVKSFLDNGERDSFELVATSPIFYEILPKGIDKSAGIPKLREITKAKRAFCIGDFYNDLGMVEMAEVGAFTANAPEELKAKADFITGSAKLGAVADFIYYLENYLEN